MVTVSVNDITVGVTRDSNQLSIGVGYSGSLHVYVLVEDIDDLIDCLEAVRKRIR